MAGIRQFDYPRIDWMSRKGKIMSSQKVAYAVSVALAGGYAPAILAQERTADLDAVIVTARKREETLLDIPQEIQTISQEQLQRANLDSIKEFSRFVPSLSYNAVVPGRGTIYFRGVADDSSSFIADASAAIYLDEQPLTQSALQPEIRLIDIERIEALPGPQGTLYGSSSQAGTLRYITNKPDPAAFTTDVALDAYTVDEGDEGYEVSGVVNIPLGDTVALRVVGFSARDAGFIDNVLGTSLGGGFDNAEFVEDDINDVEFVGGRAALRWFPNENWTVDGTVVYQKMDANSYPEEDVFTEGYNQHPELEGRELAVVRFVDESRSDEWTQLALTLQGDIGATQFTSASSYFTRRIAYFQDNTDYTFYLSHSFGANYAVYDLGPDPAGLGWRDGPYVDRIAQEFRLQGSTEKLNWVTGLFYEKVEEGFNFFSRIEDYEDTPGFAARSYYAVYYGLDPLEPGSTDNAFYHSKNDQKTEQYAAFGELTYSPNEDWSFTAGLRWFDHTRTRDYFTQQPNGNFTSNLGTAKESTSDFTKKLSVQYNINDDAMVYALYSDGFRAGGRNVVRPGTVLPADYDAGLSRQLRTRLQEPVCRRQVHAQPHRVQDGMEGLPDRGHRSGPAVRRTRRERGRRRNRGHHAGFQRLPLGLARHGAEPATARPEDQGERPAARARAGRAPAVLRGGKRRDLGRVHLPRRDRGRKHLCPLPVDLHRQFAEWHRRGSPAARVPALRFQDRPGCGRLGNLRVRGQHVQRARDLFRPGD